MTTKITADRKRRNFTLDNGHLIIKIQIEKPYEFSFSVYEWAFNGIARQTQANDPLMHAKVDTDVHGEGNLDSDEHLAVTGVWSENVYGLKKLGKLIVRLDPLFEDFEKSPYCQNIYKKHAHKK